MNGGIVALILLGVLALLILMFAVTSTRIGNSTTEPKKGENAGRRS